MKSATLAALAAALLPMPAFASGLIDNVNGIALDKGGKLVHFNGLLIDDDGKVEKLVQGKFVDASMAEPPPRKRRKDYVAPPPLPRLSFRLDGKGRTLIPGMVDAHGHVMALGLSLLTLDLSDTRTLAEAQEKIRTYARANADRKWIIGTGWDQDMWGLGRFPTAQELDAAASDVPVWLESRDGHAGWANTAALRAAGIGPATKAPAGGRIEMVAGKPSGIFIDNARAMVERFVPAPAPKDRDMAFEQAQRKLLAQGVTAIADMGTTIDDWQAFRRSADRGALRVRIMAYAAGIEHMIAIAGPEPTPWLYADRLRMGGVRFALDGALGSRGAWLKADYADAPGQRGLPLTGQTQLRNQMSRAAMDNFQIALGATGDLANQEALDAIEELAATYKGDRRWRIEHAEIVDPADLPRFARNGTIASMQPEQETHWQSKVARLGEARVKGADAWRSMIDNKVPLAFGSGVPAAAANPFPGFAAALTREDGKGEPAGGWMPEQRIRFEEAFAAYTQGAARAGFAEGRFGTLTPGERADFLLVDRDISLIRPAEIRDTQVLETWIAGKRVYMKESAK